MPAVTGDGLAVSATATSAVEVTATVALAGVPGAGIKIELYRTVFVRFPVLVVGSILRTRVKVSVSPWGRKGVVQMAFGDAPGGVKVHCVGSAGFWLSETKVVPAGKRSSSMELKSSMSVDCT